MIAIDRGASSGVRSRKCGSSMAACMARSAPGCPRSAAERAASRAARAPERSVSTMVRPTSAPTPPEADPASEILNGFNVSARGSRGKSTGYGARRLPLPARGKRSSAGDNFETFHLTARRLSRQIAAQAPDRGFGGAMRRGGETQKAGRTIMKIRLVKRAGLRGLALGAALAAALGASAAAAQEYPHPPRPSADDGRRRPQGDGLLRRKREEALERPHRHPGLPGRSARPAEGRRRDGAPGRQRHPAHRCAVPRRVGAGRRDPAGALSDGQAGRLPENPRLATGSRISTSASPPRTSSVHLLEQLFRHAPDPRRRSRSARRPISPA